MKYFLIVGGLFLFLSCSNIIENEDNITLPLINNDTTASYPSEYCEKNKNSIKITKYNKTGKKVEELFYLDLLKYEKPYLNFWLKFDSINGDTIFNNSHFLRIYNEKNTYKLNSDVEFKFEYFSFLKKSHEIILGDFNENFQYNIDNVKIYDFSTKDFFDLKIKINTSKKGEQVLRFIINDYEYIGESKKIKASYIEYLYYVE